MWSAALHQRGIDLMPSSCWLGATSWWCFSMATPISRIIDEHFGAQVLRRVDRRHREVAALDRRPVAGVAFGEDACR